MKNVKGKPDKVNELMQKPTWRKDLITYNSHPSIVFSFKWLVIIWLSFFQNIPCRQDQGGGRILDFDGQGVWGSWKLDNFHWRYMFIIPSGFIINFEHIQHNISYINFSFYFQH